MDNSIVIKTKDAEEAAFYWTLDDKFELSHIETTNHFGRLMVWFCFTSRISPDELNKLRNDYRNGHCLIEPRKYSYRRSEVKNIIHEKYAGSH